MTPPSRRPAVRLRHSGAPPPRERSSVTRLTLGLYVAAAVLAVMSVLDIMRVALVAQAALGVVAGFVMALIGLRARADSSLRQALLLLVAAGALFLGLQLRVFTEAVGSLLLALATLLVVAASNLRSTLAARAQRAATRRRLSHALTGQERERKRVARDLHDGPLQELAGVRMLLASAAQSSSQDLRAAAGEAADLLAAQIDGLRLIIADLRPAALDELGLEEALHGLARRVGSGAGLVVTVHIALARPVADPALQDTLYRVAQEALTNVVKHAQADQVRVSLRDCEHGDLLLEVEDDGRGVLADGELSDRSSAMGLLGMSERAELIDAELTLRSDGSGTLVALRIPAAVVHAPGPPPAE